MMNKIHFVANSMIGEPSLPDFLISADDPAEFMGVGASNQLDRALDGYVARRSQQEMNVLRHEYESMQFVATFATMPVKSFQEHARVVFDSKQLTAMVSREGHEINSRRGDESSRLHSETSAAKSRTSLSTLNWHEWNSCPSR